MTWRHVVVAAVIAAIFVVGGSIAAGVVIGENIARQQAGVLIP